MTGPDRDGPGIPGITVYGCEPDEADAFAEMGPRLGVVPTIVADAVSAAGVVAIPGDRCISVDHRSAVSRPTLRALARAGVEHLSTRSIGLDHIDLEAAGAVGITVENVVYDPDGVADHTLMLILMAVRDARRAIRAADRHDFRLDPVRSRDLCAMTVGVVGVGRVGRAVIRRLQGFGCRVLAHNGDRPVTAAATIVPLAELLAESDVVTLHLPLDAGTHHLIGREQIATMRPDALLVNTGRGALVDTEALVTAIEDGRLGGAGLDVIEGEEGIFYADRRTRPFDHPHLRRLERLPHTVVTPHSAFHTRRNLDDTVERTLVSCLAYERNRTHGQAQDRDRLRRSIGGT